MAQGESEIVPLDALRGAIPTTRKTARGEDLHNHDFGSREHLGPQTSTVIRLAQVLTKKYPHFFTIKGLGVGDKETNSFITC